MILGYQPNRLVSEKWAIQKREILQRLGLLSQRRVYWRQTRRRKLQLICEFNDTNGG